MATIPTTAGTPQEPPPKPRPGRPTPVPQPGPPEPPPEIMIADNADAPPTLAATFDGDDLARAYLARRTRAADSEALERLKRRAAKAAPATPAAAPHTTGTEATAEGGGVLDAAGGVLRDVGRGLVEAPLQVVGGVADAVNETLQTAGALGEWVEQAASLPGLKVSADGIEVVGADELQALRADGQDVASAAQLPTTGQADSVTGSLVRGVAQWLTAFLPASKALTAAGAPAVLGKWGTAMAAGAAADTVAFDEHQQRLSNLVEQFPALSNPVTQYLAAQPGDSMAEGKFKNALEGLGLGALTDGVALGLKSLRAWKQARDAAQAGRGADAVATASGDVAQARAATGAPGTPPPDVPPPDLAKLGDSGKPLMVDAVDEAPAWGFLRVAGASDGKAININLARLATPDDVKAAIDATAKTFEGSIDAARRGVMSQQQTAALADDMGLTVEALLGRRKGAAFNAEEALAARRLLVASAENLTTLAKAAATPAASDVDRLAFRRALAVHAGIQQQVSGLTAEAGRALSQFRIPADATGGLRARALREMIDLSGGPVDSQRLAEMVARLDTPEGLATFARQADKATTKDMLLEAWINGLLSGPQTHAANILSNGLTALWQVPERALAGGLRALKGGAGAQSGEAVAQAFGLVKGARDGFRLAAKAFATGEPSDAMAKIEASKYRAITSENMNLSGTAGRFADLLGEGVRIPGRALMAEDELFKAVGYRMELYAQAYRDAANAGLKGDAFAQRVASIVSNPPEHITLAAQDAARMQTFTSELGTTGKMAQRIVADNPALRLVFPFIRTPVNIVKFVGIRSPLAPLAASVRADIAAGGARADMAQARIAMGSMAMAVAADLAMEGHVTGAGPTDPYLRATLKRTGWQPYSFKVGDQYVSYNRLDPVGMMFGLAADMAEITGQMESAEANEIAAGVVMAVSNNLVNKTYLEGFSTLVGAFNQMSPEAGAARGEKVIESLAASVIPTIFATVQRTLDPTLREADGMLQAARARIPGYGSDLPPRRNLWGEPMLLTGGLGPDIVSPLYTSKRTGSAIDEEMARLQLGVKLPPRAIGGVELTPDEYSRYVELAGNAAKDPGTGKGLKDSLSTLIKSPEYARLTDGPDGGKATAIQNTINAYRDLARALMREEFPDIAALIDEKAIEKAQALGGMR